MEKRSLKKIEADLKTNYEECQLDALLDISPNYASYIRAYILKKLE